MKEKEGKGEDGKGRGGGYKVREKKGRRVRESGHSSAPLETDAA